MKVVIIIGPQAVGKMTVGQELAEMTGYKLFHNHLPIELVSPFFSYADPVGRRLVSQIRALFFDAFAQSDCAGVILTFVWQFGVDGDREYMEGVAKLFQDKGAEIFWVELEAELAERLVRNRSENRLTHKATKRDLAFSERALIESYEKYRTNSLAGEMPQDNYFRIDNTNLAAKEVARQIRSRLLS